MQQILNYAPTLTFKAHRNTRYQFKYTNFTNYTIPSEEFIFFCLILTRHHPEY